MSQRERRRRSVGFILALEAILVTSLACGLVFGLRQTAVPPTTTTTTTGTTTTTAPPTTSPLTCPGCNSSYFLRTDIDVQTLYGGQISDYYTAGESFVYFNLSHSAPYNITLARTSKCTGIEYWSKTLCGFNSPDRLQAVRADQANGDTYFLYQCDLIYLNRYDIGGNLIWSNQFNATFLQLNSPITLNSETQILYAEFYVAATPSSLLCAYHMLDGTQYWCYSNATDDQSYADVAYDNARGYVYAIIYGSIDSTHAPIYKLNSTTGTFVSQIITTGVVNIVGVAVDANGGIYVFGASSDQLDGASIQKFDSAGISQWQTLIVGPQTVPYANFNYAWSANNLLYDSLHNIVLVTANTGHYVATADQIWNVWVATADASSGSQLSYYEQSQPNVTESLLVVFSGGDFLGRTAYYSYLHLNATEQGYWTTDTFCY